MIPRQLCILSVDTKQTSLSSPIRFITPSSSETVSLPSSTTLELLLIFAPLRSGVYVTSIFAGAFAFGIGFDVGISSFWDSWNRGVRAHLPAYRCRSDRRAFFMHRSSGRTFATNTFRRNRCRCSRTIPVNWWSSI